MRRINYRSIVSDFDGTLIDDNQKISPEVVAKIDEYVKSGGVFAVCTGRMLFSILPRVRELGLKGIVIASQGSTIADIISGDVIKCGGLEYTDMAEICKYLESIDQPFNIYSGDDLYTNVPADTDYLIKYQDIIGVKAISLSEKLSDFVLKSKLFCQKATVFVRPDEQEELYAKIKEKFKNKFHVTCSANVLIDISPIGDDKGQALKFLAEHYGIPIEKTLAVGDNLNDLEMILAAGVGVAVGNAKEELKRAADFVSITNNEGAIAQIIEKYGFA